MHRGPLPCCSDGLLQTSSQLLCAAALRHLIKAAASEQAEPTELCGRSAYMSFMHMQAFLSLCQGNHYQFDTIRRAKHSSAMVLYHLHNPDAPAFASTCNRWAMATAAPSCSCTKPLH